MQINPIFLNKELIETDSNANGTYEKYADGRLICYGEKTFTGINCDFQVGNIYYTPQIALGGYPMNFIAKPKTAQIISQSILGLAEYTSQSKTSIGYAFFFNAMARTGVNLIISYIAIGRWK